MARRRGQPFLQFKTLPPALALNNSARIGLTPLRSVSSTSHKNHLSFLPFDSIAPRRFRCQPDSADSARLLSPRFTSLNYGQAAYGQLSLSTADEIWRGADDESEMGAFHHLYAPQRDRNLRIRLREYLRVGLEAGLIYES